MMLERSLGLWAWLTADRWSHRHGFERSEPDGQGREDRANPQSVSLEGDFRPWSDSTATEEAQAYTTRQTWRP